MSTGPSSFYITTPIYYPSDLPHIGHGYTTVAVDALNGTFKGGFVETPTTVVDAANVLPVLQNPDSLYPKPSKAY